MKLAYQLLNSKDREPSVERPCSTMSGTGLRVAGGIAKKTGPKKAAGVSGESRKQSRCAFKPIGVRLGLFQPI